MAPSSATETAGQDKWSRFKSWIEVPKDAGDIYYENDSLTNRDLIPIPHERRTWSPLLYFTYWIVEGVSISGYTTTSSLVGLGLSVRQSLGCAVIAGCLYGVMAVIMGWIGSHHHIGYPVYSRVTFGIHGAKFAIIIRCITGTIWFGVQSYYGGQAVRVVISAMKPSFATWNTFAKTSGNITSADFVGMIIYLVIIIPCMYIPPERLHSLFFVTFGMVLMSIIGMLIYSMKENHGPGTYFSQPAISDGGQLGWLFVQGIFSIIGNTGTGILGQSDWTRYATKKNGPVFAQLLGAPIALTFSGCMGALITSASYDLFGEAQWNPLNFLAALQSYENNSSRARAGVFFAGCGFIAQQVAINLLLNSVSTGMDMTGLVPKYLNIRRASYIVMAISFACCPWYLQSSAKVVIIFGSGWGCFCSSLTGVVIAKYFIVDRRKVLLGDLYKADSSSIYWYYHGFDWRTFIAWAIGTVFLLPGLAAAANSQHKGFWTYIFNVSYLWGLSVSLLSAVALHYIFPKMNKPFTSDMDEKYTPEGDVIEILDSISYAEEDVSSLEKRQFAVKVTSISDI